MRIKSYSIIAFAIFLIGVVVLMIWYDSGLKARKFQNNYIFRSLSVGIELYREESGAYPKSMADIQLNTQVDKEWHESMRNTLNLTQSNIWHDVYSYEHSTNGFTIIVSGPDVAPVGWFGHQRVIKKSYSVGDAFNKFYSP